MSSWLVTLHLRDHFVSTFVAVALLTTMMSNSVPELDSLLVISCALDQIFDLCFLSVQNSPEGGVGGF